MPVLELSKDYVIEETEKKIKIEIPQILINKLKRSKKTDKGILKLFGVLKNSKINPVEYQKEMRAEWER